MGRQWRGTLPVRKLTSPDNFSSSPDSWPQERGQRLAAAEERAANAEAETDVLARDLAAAQERLRRCVQVQSM